MLEIDGSYGEGGGQLLRMAAALSALTGEKVKIKNIRVKRPNPGLSAQHVTAIKSVASLCGADVGNLKKGAKEVIFSPGTMRGGAFSFDIGTAGSITLVLQACMLPSVMTDRDSRFTIMGGTDVKWSPPWDYFSNVFLPLLNRVGVEAKVHEVRRGYYPRGGGRVSISVIPAKSIGALRSLGGGQLTSIEGIAHVGNLPEHIARRMRRSAEQCLTGYSVNIQETCLRGEKAVGKGGAIVLWAKKGEDVLGASALAEPGVSAEEVGKKAAEELKREIEANGALDIHSSDQILPYLALSKEASYFTVRELTNHARTNIWLIEKFLDVKFRTQRFNSIWKVEVVV